MSDWSLLLSPLRVGPRELRNRVVVTGHTTCYVDADDLPDERDVAYFAARAEGGAALLCTGTNAVHASSPLPFGVYRNLDERIVPRHAAIADAVHAHDALMLVQLGHLAQRSYDEPVPTWAPSAVAYHTGGALPHAMTVPEIRDVVAAFGEAAARATRAGLDGVEVGLGHGQLVNLFLSPLTNVRDDAYGGSPERRLRFALDVMAAAREGAGGEAIVGARVNGSDGVEGGLDAPAWLAISTAIAAAGLASYLNVSLDFHQSLVPSMHQPHGSFLEHAEALRRRVAVPVLAAGRLTDPEEAEAAIAAGRVDAVGLTRAHIADPDFVAKLRAGRRRQIRPCIGCGQLCIGAVQRGRPISCIYNPLTGSERTRGPLLRRPPAAALDVLVVGGGPGGMEAARVAALRGHRATLLERDDALGGAARLAAAVPGRAEFGRLVDWYARELARLGVDVRLGVEADRDLVAALAADAVVLACGARPARPPWASDLQRVVALRDVIAQRLPLAGHVAVVDHDHRGQSLQAAVWALERGCSVTIVSERLAVAPAAEPSSLQDLYGLILARGGELRPLQRIAAVAAAGGALAVELVEEWSGRRRTLGADWVVTTAAAADERLWLALADRPAVLVVGDARAPREIPSAVHEAFDAVLGLPALVEASA